MIQMDLSPAYLIPKFQNSLQMDSQALHEVRFSAWMITKTSHLEKECSLRAICEERGRQARTPGLREPADSLEPALM